MTSAKFQPETVVPAGSEKLEIVMAVMSLSTVKSRERARDNDVSREAIFTLDAMPMPLMYDR